MFKKVFLISILSLSVMSVFNPAQANIFSGVQEKPTISPMLKETLPAVVSISVSKGKKIDLDFEDLPKNKEVEEMMKRYNDLQKKYNKEKSSLGSGVIIDSDKGYIITNQHVIDEANEIKIIFNNKEEIIAKLIGEDKKTDIAVLQFNTKELKTKIKDVKLSNLKEVEVGDFVVAIGNPYGLSQTVTTGIVSALGRGGIGINGVENFIQTDAAINQGNSGGALLDHKGELIGMNTAILSPSGGSTGIGFAIPSTIIKIITEQLITNGKTKRVAFGIMGATISDKMKERLDLKVKSGVAIFEVNENSPAEKGGIQIGDVIVEIDGDKIDSIQNLVTKVTMLKENQKVKVVFYRGSEKKTTEVVMIEREKVLPEESDNEGYKSDFLRGIIFEYKGGKFSVKEINEETPFTNLFLESDEIISVNNKKIKSMKELDDLFEKEDSFAILLNRDNREKIIYFEK